MFSKLLACGLASVAFATNNTNVESTTQMVSPDGGNGNNQGTPSTSGAPNVVNGGGNNTDTNPTTAAPPAKAIISQEFVMGMPDLTTGFTSDERKAVAAATAAALVDTITGVSKIDWLGIKQAGTSGYIAETGTRTVAARMLEAALRMLTTKDSTVEYQIVAEKGSTAADSAKKALDDFAADTNLVAGLSTTVSTKASAALGGKNFTTAAVDVSTIKTDVKSDTADPAQPVSSAMQNVVAASLVTVSAVLAFF